MLSQKINIRKQTLNVLFLLLSISGQLVFSTTRVTGSSTFSVAFSEYNSDIILDESFTIAAGSQAGEATLNWGGTVYSGTAVGLCMFLSGSDGSEKSHMVVIFTDETFSQAVLSWTYVDSSTSQGGFELGRLDRNTGDFSVSDFHASSLTGSTTYSSTYTDINTNDIESGSYIFSGDGDSIGTFTDSGFVYDLFFYNRFFAFAYIDGDGTYGLYYGLFTDSTFSHYIAFDSFKYFDGVVQVGISEGAGSGSLTVDHDPAYSYSGTSLASSYSWYEFNSTVFALNDDSFEFSSRSDESLSGQTLNDSSPLNGLLMGPVVVSTAKVDNDEMFFSLNIYDDSDYSNFSGLLVGQDLPGSDGRWGEFSEGSKTSGNLSYSEASSSGNTSNEEIVTPTSVEVTISGTPETEVDRIPLTALLRQLPPAITVRSLSV